MGDTPQRVAAAGRGSCLASVRRVAARYAPLFWGMRPLPASPDGWRAFADRLIARDRYMSPAQARALARLGDEAFYGLLPVLEDEIRRCVGQRDRSAGEDLGTDGTHRVVEALEAVFQPRHTSEVLDMVERTTPPDGDLRAHSGVVRLLAQSGEEAAITPFLIRLLRERRALGYLLSHHVMRRVLSSPLPEASRFLTEVLRDADAPPELRHYAFGNAARNGEPEAVAAVLALSDARCSLPPLAEFMGLDELGSEPSGGGPHIERTCLRDIAVVEGVRWGLFTSWAMGAQDDLWVARHDGGRWVDPLFTGLRLAQHGSQDWVSRFVENPDLTRDSDGDGWTDLMEWRLGTDPRNPDTDADGIPDRADLNPLAAPRPLGDVERALAAAFRALFFECRHGAPCVVHLPPGVEPFELPGWGWVTVALRAGDSSPLLELGRRREAWGAMEVRWGQPYYDFAHRELPRRGRSEEFLWSSDRSEVKLGAGIGFGVGNGGCGYDIHVRRFAEEWVVTSLENTWIS